MPLRKEQLDWIKKTAPERRANAAKADEALRRKMNGGTVDPQGVSPWPTKKKAR